MSIHLDWSNLINAQGVYTKVIFLGKIMSKMIDSSALKAGDVLLCFKNGKFDVFGKIIQHITGSQYVHAGIFIGNNTVAESMTSGLIKEPFENVLARYDHLAVFRRYDAWGSKNTRILNYFVDQSVNSGSKYNFSGVFKFKKTQLKHQQTLTEQLEDYFDGNLVQKSPVKHKYFCSEFVVDCFRSTGFIGPSAAVVYKPETTAPGDLGNDATFGYFLGYITGKGNYEVDKNDEFYCHPTLSEIFGATKI